VATATAMPAPHTPQRALTRKMIAVAMHAFPNSPAEHGHPLITGYIALSFFSDFNLPSDER
jgi:hypothetical protein